MAPAPLPLMIVRLGLRPTLRTQPIPHFLVLQVNVNLSFPQIQVHAFHIPRGFDPQNSSIQFAVLHAENCRMLPLKSRNSLICRLGAASRPFFSLNRSSRGFGRYSTDWGRDRGKSISSYWERTDEFVR